MGYKLSIEKPALKTLKKIPKPYKQKIIETINMLKDNPKPLGAKKLVGRDGWRIRINDYRIIYITKESISTILVISIGHRKNIYRH
ncbi:MAG: hypothetical protein AMJ43_03550 [Coxiella sp. DG_40]|nr:MAG: hypothetical protein AMJ43_03550 [Coxiella sp. DG_40]